MVSRARRSAKHSDFGARLLQLRTRAGLGQRELGRTAGLHPSYISQLETGARKAPTYPVLADLARALGVTVADLAGDAYQSKPLPAAVEQDARDLAELEEEERRAVRGVILAFKLKRRPLTDDRGVMPTTEPDSEPQLISKMLREKRSHPGVVSPLATRPTAEYAV